MDLKELTKPLEIKDIDFRIQSINKGWYATILAYKDARVDMNRLDDVVWAWLWKREHFDNNTRCKVSIYNTDIKEWVSKEDVWTKSNTEAEKGLASDSFKRACFNWGIWRELYDYPVMQIKLNSDEFELKEYNWKTSAKSTWNFKLKEWKWTSEFSEWNLISLVARDNKWKVRFSFWMWDNTEVIPQEEKWPDPFKNTWNWKPKVDKKWYNDFEKHKDVYIDKIADWELTPESIVKWLEDKWYSLSKKTKEDIINLK